MLFPLTSYELQADQSQYDSRCPYPTSAFNGAQERLSLTGRHTAVAFVDLRCRSARREYSGHKDARLAFSILTTPVRVLRQNLPRQ